jgi:hypothetical protein
LGKRLEICIERWCIFKPNVFHIFQLHFFLDICVPCIVPTQCVKCSGKGNMKLIPNPYPNLQIAVVMHQGIWCFIFYVYIWSNDKTYFTFLFEKGRFDLRAASFLCMDCREITVTDKNEYIFFWILACTCQNIHQLYVLQELFAMWYYLRHKSPLNSEKMFIKTIEEISKESGRINCLEF